MITIQHPEQMQAKAIELRQKGKRLVLVPTMGFLHEGHLSLMRIARQRGDVIITSIFVNPSQFGPQEDLEAYPRDFEQDEGLCRSEGVDIIFYPGTETMYLPDVSVYVDETLLSRGLCGLTRPTHFRGVLTIVAKLFNICLPHAAVFGEKDAQQLRLLRRMVRDLNFPVEMLSGPIVRESDGLAMSTRNKYLTDIERAEALCLRHSLDLAEECYAGGERDASTILDAMRGMITGSSSGVIDYLAAIDDENLETIDTIDRPALIALAVKFGKARLLDNTVLGL
ncbi:MAG: pantoate--beta-alanine ligase [Verrucomicrobiota bacterium]